MPRNKKPTATNNVHPNPAPAGSKPATCNSPTELREFLDHMKGKDPGEVLGTSSGYALGVAMIQATVITVITMVALTVGPYYLSKFASAAKPEPGKDTPSETAEPNKTPPAQTTAPATPTSTAKTPPNTAKDILDKLGGNETKPANPKTNPLDKSTDDLFKDIDKK